jgi:hypothetical protein
MSINCQPPATATPAEHQEWADKWHPSQVLEPTATGLCHGCPRKTACADWALTFVDPVTGTHVSGVWGGTTTDQRATMRGTPSKCGTRSGYLAHQRQQEPACQPCKDAAARFSKEQRAKAKTRAA